MQKMFKLLLKYSQVDIIEGGEANVIRDSENKDYVVIIPNRSKLLNLNVIVVDKINYEEVSIYDVMVNKNQIGFRVTDSNVIMNSYILIKEITDSQKSITQQVNDTCADDIVQLKSDFKQLTEKFNELSDMIKDKLYTMEMNISSIKKNNPKKNENNNIPRVDIKPKQ